MVATPLRTFIVGNDFGEASFEAHQPHVDASGALQLLRYDDENYIPWTVEMFAKGEWKRVRVSLPSPEDIRVMKANEEDANARKRERALFEHNAMEEYQESMQRDRTGKPRRQ